jgi:signal transduction histidine kinase
MQRALELKKNIWPALWSALLLVLLLLVWLSLRRYFIYRKHSALASYPDDSLVGFENQLLLALPVAFVLLDQSLAIRFVNHFGESYFGQFASFDEANFAEFCQDQTLLKHLHSSFLSARSVPYEKLTSEFDYVLLNTVSNRERQVFIQWYKLYLGGLDYLLGVIRDPQEVILQGASDISQEQLQELSHKLFRVQDDERQHLADELHDGLCQSLAALKMQVFRVEKGIADEENREDCRKARQFIAQIIEDVRRLSHDLSPVILDDLGLGGALAHLVNNFAALNDLKVSISVPDLEGCFASDAARHVYRIVQEAVNNVAKHAQASLLVLEAEVTDETVRFRVRDDGVGFGDDHNNDARSGAGLGLTSMAQRVQLLGGEFSVSSKPGDGCLVTFTLPRKSST